MRSPEHPGRLSVGLVRGRVMLATSDGYRILMSPAEARRIASEVGWNAELIDWGLDGPVYLAAPEARPLKPGPARSRSQPGNP